VLERSNLATLEVGGQLRRLGVGGAAHLPEAKHVGNGVGAMGAAV